MRLHARLVLLPLALFASASCTSEAPPAAAPDRLPPGLVVATEPAGAQDVADAKKTVKAGDPVTLVGRIGGRVKPFVDGRAIFSVVSPKLRTCSEIEGDTCETPWDYCCEDKETMRTHTVTVRLVGEGSEPLAFGVQGQAGLAPGARVVVEGKVHENDAAFVVDARRVHVAQAR